MYKQKSVLLGFICALLCSLLMFAGSGFLSARLAFAEGETTGETSYTIQYLDSSEGTPPLTTTNQQSVTASQFPVSLSAPDAKVGHTFDYWGFSKTSPLDTDGASGNFVLTKSNAEEWADDEGVITIYAYWQLTLYTVGFVYSGYEYGTVTDATGFVETNCKVTANTDIDLRQEEYIPKCAGHSFDGWFEDSACLTPITRLVGVTSDVTLYGKFTRLNYVITFADETLGYEPIAFKANIDRAYDYNGQKGLLTDKNPTREGYTFAGWYITENCAEGSHIGEFYIFQTPVTLYAKWEKKPSMLWLYFAGGSCLLIGGGFVWWYFANRRKLTLG